MQFKWSLFCRCQFYNCMENCPLKLLMDKFQGFLFWDQFLTWTYHCQNQKVSCCFGHGEAFWNTTASATHHWHQLTEGNQSWKRCSVDWRAYHTFDVCSTGPGRKTGAEYYLLQTHLVVNVPAKESLLRTGNIYYETWNWSLFLESELLQVKIIEHSILATYTPDSTHTNN